MKTEYDVKVPHQIYSNAPYAASFWKFYDSEHQNVKLEYDTTDEAKSSQKAICMLTSRNRIHDVIITRSMNVLYLIRSDLSDNG